MAYIFSLAMRASNNVIAPLKVVIDKSVDAISYKENNESKTKENVVNPDGIDKPEIKKMERLYPPTNTLYGYLHFFSDPTQVHDGLYLGSAYNASCWYTLEKYNIRYIVNVTIEITNYYESSGITYYRIPIRDDNNESIQNYFNESYEKIEEFLNKKNGNVLIHCYMGASRSATIAAKYIAKKNGGDVTEVIQNLTEKRPIVNPTKQFVKDLLKETSD